MSPGPQSPSLYLCTQVVGPPVPGGCHGQSPISLAPCRSPGPHSRHIPHLQDHPQRPSPRGRSPGPHTLRVSEDKSGNKGLASVDRSNKATLLLTAPRSIQVVCKGFTPAHISFQYAGERQGPFRPGRQAHKIWFTAKAYSNTTNMCGTNIIVSSTDSDLEAFSHNLADDSFAPLPDRTGANTNYLNEQFLSYYPQSLLR